MKNGSYSWTMADVAANSPKQMPIIEVCQVCKTYCSDAEILIEIQSKSSQSV